MKWSKNKESSKNKIVKVELFWRKRSLKEALKGYGSLIKKNNNFENITIRLIFLFLKQINKHHKQNKMKINSQVKYINKKY